MEQQLTGRLESAVSRLEALSAGYRPGVTPANGGAAGIRDPPIAAFDHTMTALRAASGERIVGQVLDETKVLAAAFSAQKLEVLAEVEQTQLCDRCYETEQKLEGRQRENLREMLALLEHSCQCSDRKCERPNCLKVKGLFRHGTLCETRISGACVLCKKMWYLLHLHARACKESECQVPRCRDIKECQQQSDFDK